MIILNGGLYIIGAVRLSVGHKIDYGPIVQWSLWTNGPTDKWTNGPMVQWTNGPMDQWSNKPMDQWINAQLVKAFTAGVNSDLPTLPLF